MTKVVNLRKEEYDVYIGRENRTFGLKQSRWANPFRIGKDGSRWEVIRKYQMFITQQLEEDLGLWIELLELKGKILGCWCKPKACHGDVLVELLDGGTDE